MVEFTKFESVNLQSHSEINEKWVQERIAEDPSVLGLGDVELKDKERIQPNAGRLDLLLQESGSSRRYEVELQLGRSDESHIIRTIEYWDIERRRYPQYDHCAVIIAEDITSRFLNVISLFNGHIPIIALQMTAVQNDNKVGLFFTRVLDELNLGLVDDDEEISEPTDRNYWNTKGSPGSIALTDKMLEMVQDIAPGHDLNYNKHYIGLSKDGRSNNFIAFLPKKKFVCLNVRLPKAPENDEIIEQSDLDEMEYDRRSNQYRLRIYSDDLTSQNDVIRSLIQKAWDIRSA